MLGHAVLLVVVAGASVSLADDGTRSLAEAVRAVNQQAAKSPESRSQSPLTEDEVVKSIERFSRSKPLPEGGYQEAKRLSDEEFQKLKRIVTTRRLPTDVILRQFVRYNDGTCVEHGWWVRLILMRQDTCPFSLTIRQESVFRRPYTQKERQFQADMRRTGLVPTMGRLVAYFDEDPRFGAVQEFSAQEADRLAQAVKKAIHDGKTEDLLKTYHWEKVDEATRTWVREKAEQLMKRQLATVSVSPRRFSGRLTNWWGLRIWDPNLPVLGYIVLEFADKDAPRSIWLEFGETQDGARLVNYIVSRDDGPRMIGKPLPGGGFRVQAFLTFHPEKGWSELYSQIDAPDELPALQNANLELWKVNPTRHETPRVEKREPKPLQ
jgi:hypothetical protein